MGLASQVADSLGFTDFASKRVGWRLQRIVTEGLALSIEWLRNRYELVVRWRPRKYSQSSQFRTSN